MITNCVFETKDKRCQKSRLTSFHGIICDMHLLKVFGLSANVKRFELPRHTTIVGPFLNVAPNIVFETNCVVFPTKKFLDYSLAIDNDSDTTTKTFDLYTLNPEFENFMRELTLQKNYNNSSLFLSEVARNLFVETPSTDVDMALKSDETKTHLKTDIQTHLTNLKSTIENAPYHKFCIDNIEVLDRKTGLSAFERFLLFNMYTDHTYQGDLLLRPATLNYNLYYVNDVGYVASRQMIHTSDLVAVGHVKMNPKYMGWKIRKELKQCAGSRINTARLADSQNTVNITHYVC